MPWTKRAALCLLAGCNAVFGLHQQDPPPDAPDPRGSIQGHVDFVTVSNDAAFLPTTTSRAYTRFELAVYVIDDSGGSTPVTYHDDTGTFEAPRSAGRTRIQLRFGASRLFTVK